MSQFEQERLKEFEENDMIVYPHYFHTTATFKDFIIRYDTILNPSQIRNDIVVSVAGRVVEKRSVGKKLVFYTVSSNGHTLQYLANLQHYEDKERFTTINKLIHRGDIVGAIGYPGKSKTGELSIYPIELKILTPCFKQYIPKQHFGLQDVDLRFKNRHFGK